MLSKELFQLYVWGETADQLPKANVRTMRVENSAITRMKDEILDDENSLIQFRFQNDEGDLAALSASSLADCLTGLSELAGNLHKNGLFATVTAPDVVVRPVKEGSFLVEVMLSAQASLETVTTVATHAMMASPATPIPVEATATTSEAVSLGKEAIELGKSVVDKVLTPGAVGFGIYKFLINGKPLVEGYRWLTKLFTQKVAHFDYLENGNVRVQWDDGVSEEIDLAIWKTFQKSSTGTKRGLKKIAAPLGGDATTLSIRTGSPSTPSETIEEKEPIAEIDMAMYRAVVAIPDDIEESSVTFEAEGTLEVIDFTGSGKWRITAAGTTRNAVMEDEKFLQSVDQRRAIHKGDIFQFEIREDKIVKNGRTTREWTIIKVMSHRRGAFDDEPIDTQN